MRLSLSPLRLASPKPAVSAGSVNEWGAPRDKPKKAWHGQDKDKFFHDKYAHVHAKQKKLKEEEIRAKQERTKLKELDRPTRPSPVERDNRPGLLLKTFLEKHVEYLRSKPTHEFIYGTSPVSSALKTRKVYSVLSSNLERDVKPAIVQACKAKGISMRFGVPLQKLNTITGTTVHNNLVAEVEKRRLPVVSEIQTKSDGSFSFGTEENIKPLGGRRYPIGLYLDEITDTHNVGAIFRSLYWLGVDFVLMSERNCAPLSPAVYKAAAGAAEFLRIGAVHRPLQFLESAKESWNVLAAVVNERPDLSVVSFDDLPEVAANRPTIIVLGSESSGLRTQMLTRATAQCTMKAPIELDSTIDSLNVSVAAALLAAKATAAIRSK